MEKEDYIYEEEISVKDIILQINSYLKEILRNWKIVVLLCLIFVSFFVHNHLVHVTTYNSELRFLVEGQSGGGGITSLLGSLGIKKGGKVNPYKIVEVAQSTKILNKLLSSKRNGEKNIANRIFDAYELREKWSSDDLDLSNYSYTSDDENEVHNIVVKSLSSFLWGIEKTNGKIKFSFNEDNGIYTVLTRLKDDQLAVDVTKELYDLVRNFFEDEIFLNQNLSAKILKDKSDSIKISRDLKVFELARHEDKNQNLVRKISNAKATILRQEIQALNFAYGEVLKNYEMTDVNLKDLQPLFMEIETPFLPLMPNNSSLFKNLMFGLIFGTFLSCGFIIFRKIYRDIMA